MATYQPLNHEDLTLEILLYLHGLQNHTIPFGIDRSDIGLTQAVHWYALVYHVLVRSVCIIPTTNQYISMVRYSKPGFIIMYQYCLRTFKHSKMLPCLMQIHRLSRRCSL